MTRATVKIKDIEKDEDIYPRHTVSGRTVESYVEDLKAGARFPPPLVQKILTDGEAHIIALDGWHTTEAYRLFNRGDGVAIVDEIEVEFWRDEVLDKEEHLEELLSESALRNRKHGLRLSDTDLRMCCLKIVERRPMDQLVGIQKELAQMFGVSESWVSQMVGSSIKRRKTLRDSFIYQQDKQGVPKAEISKKTGISRGRVSQVVKKLSAKETNEDALNVAFTEFYSSLNLIEALNLGITLRLVMMGWEQDEIVSHLQLKEHSQGADLPYEGIFDKGEQLSSLIMKWCNAKEEEGQSLHVVVPELHKHLQGYLQTRLETIQQDLIEGLPRRGSA